MAALRLRKAVRSPALLLPVPALIDGRGQPDHSPCLWSTWPLRADSSTLKPSHHRRIGRTTIRSTPTAAAAAIHGFPSPILIATKIPKATAAANTVMVLPATAALTRISRSHVGSVRSRSSAISAGERTTPSPDEKLPQLPLPGHSLPSIPAPLLLSGKGCDSGFLVWFESRPSLRIGRASYQQVDYSR